MEASAFSSGELIEQLIEEIENLYSENFDTFLQLDAILYTWLTSLRRARKYEVGPRPPTLDNEDQKPSLQYIQGGYISWCGYTGFNKGYY